MPFVTSVERIGIEKGHAEGRAEGRREGLIEAIALGVELKFPRDRAALMALVEAITDVDALRLAVKAVKTAASADEFRAALAK